MNGKKTSEGFMDLLGKFFPDVKTEIDFLFYTWTLEITPFI